MATPSGIEPAGSIAPLGSVAIDLAIAPRATNSLSVTPPPRRRWNSSLMVLAQNTAPNTANNGHSNVYAQLRPLPPSARWNCQSPSHSIPQNATTANRCHAIHCGEMRNRHTGPDDAWGVSSSVPGVSNSDWSDPDALGMT